MAMRMIKRIFPILFNRRAEHIAVLEDYLVQQNTDFVLQQNGDQIFLRT